MAGALGRPCPLKGFLFSWAGGVGALFLFYLYECFAYIYVYVPYAHLVPAETRRGHQIPWSWSYRWL